MQARDARANTRTQPTDRHRRTPRDRRHTYLVAPRVFLKQRAYALVRRIDPRRLEPPLRLQQRHPLQHVHPVQQVLFVCKALVVLAAVVHLGQHVRQHLHVVRLGRHAAPHAPAAARSRLVAIVVGGGSRCCCSRRRCPSSASAAADDAAAFGAVSRRRRRRGAATVGVVVEDALLHQRLDHVLVRDHADVALRARRQPLQEVARAPPAHLSREEPLCRLGRRLLRDARHRGSRRGCCRRFGGAGRSEGVERRRAAAAAAAAAAAPYCHQLAPAATNRTNCAEARCRTHH
jgi:hypothetical protein